MNQKLCNTIFFILLAFFSAQAVCAQRELRPVDQAALQPDFFTFRAQLQATIARRDTQALLEIVHKDIKCSFGGGDGLEEFKDMWGLNKPDSRLWETLATALALGGTFGRDGDFSAPYIFSRWPDGIDDYGNYAIVGANVHVRAAPNRLAESISSLTFVIVEDAKSKLANENWISIRLPNGKTGFVDKRYARSSVDYRAIFKKIDGKWQMTVFIAGD